MLEAAIPSADDVLSRALARFGHPALRPGQADVIADIFAGRPVIAVMAPPRVAAFTATATPEVREDIAVQLGLDDAALHVRGFDRPNLHYGVTKAGGAADKADKLVELVRTRDGGVALVYAATRKNAEAYAAALKTAGMRARVYHAGLQDGAR